MKNFLYLITVIIFCASCTEKKQGNFNIQGKIIGLKKGTIYLEKIDIDSTQILDSVSVNNGTETFTFSEDIKEANLFSISLDKSLTRKILFFSEPGNISIETELNKFISKAKITGSVQQDLLNKHDEYTKQIQYQNLDIIKEKFIAQKEGALDKIAELDNKYNQNLKRIYLFSANYAINNGSNAVAPYIAISRMDNATPKLKKQIYDALTPEVKESKYGLLLKKELDITL
ncbi:DUF4369 domain-containing protein [Wenyingzhuangia sp. IMCC45467]